MYKALQIIIATCILTGCVSKANRLNQEGILLAQKGKYEKAVAKFHEAVSEDPENFSSLLNLARTYLILRKPKKALPSLEKAHKLFPDNLQAQLLQIHAYFLLKETKTAEEKLKKLLEVYPKNFYLYMAMGDIALASKKLEQAISYYQKALKINSRADRVYVQLGRTYLLYEMKKLNKRPHVSLGKFKDQQEMFSRIGNLLAGGGIHLDRAAACFRKAVYLNSKNIEAYIFLGLLAFHRTDYEEADLEWNQALLLDEKNIFLYVSLGVNAQRRKLYKKAISYFQMAQKLAPKQPQAYILEVFTEIELQHYKKAIFKSLKVIALFPEMELELQKTFAQDKRSYVPWLLEMVADKNKKIAMFAAKSLAYISDQKLSLDPKYWQHWWKTDQAK